MKQLGVVLVAWLVGVSPVVAYVEEGARAGTCEATESEAKLTCTSLALLAFMGEGHYAGQDGPYRKTVDLALSFLVDEYSIVPSHAHIGRASGRGRV